MRAASIVVGETYFASTSQKDFQRSPDDAFRVKVTGPVEDAEINYSKKKVVPFDSETYKGDAKILVYRRWAICEDGVYKIDIRRLQGTLGDYEAIVATKEEAQVLREAFFSEADAYTARFKSLGINAMVPVSQNYRDKSIRVSIPLSQVEWVLSLLEKGE